MADFLRHAVTPDFATEVRGYTQRNDLFGARLYICEMLGRKELFGKYADMEIAREFLGYMPESMVPEQRELDKQLKRQLKAFVINWETIWNEL